MTQIAISNTGARRLQQVADEYRARGYDVLLEPKRNQLPRALARFHPDLVARKGEELIVVEVKSRSALRQDAQIQELARAVREQPGWRFELIIAHPEHAGVMPEGAQAWNDRDVVQRLAEARRLLGAGHTEAALLLAWSATEATLRILAAIEGIDLARQDSPYLLKQLAFSGVLTREQFDFLQDLSELRNTVAHGHGLAGFALMGPPQIGALIDLTAELLREGTGNGEAA